MANSLRQGADDAVNLGAPLDPTLAICPHGRWPSVKVKETMSVKLEQQWEKAERAYREAQEEYFGTDWERVRTLISPEGLANLSELKRRSEEAHAAMMDSWSK